MADYFERKEVFHRFDKGVNVYICFQNLRTKKYYVQSCDFYNEPFDKMNFDYLKQQVVELFYEESMIATSPGFESIESALADFNGAFSNIKN